MEDNKERAAELFSEVMRHTEIEDHAEAKRLIEQALDDAHQRGYELACDLDEVGPR